MKFPRIRKFFTLPEVVAVLAILGLMAALAVPMLRDPSPASRLDQAVLDFETFCARVRYTAMEQGKDQAVFFHPETSHFYMKDPADTETEVNPAKAWRKWKLPEDCKPENLAETFEGTDPEVFRFFPDGGASGNTTLTFRCGNYGKVFEISLLTGLVTARDLTEDETL